MGARILARLSQLFQKPAGAPRPGAVLDGRYRLDAELGRGGMGIVYRAYDLQQARPVALKVVNGQQTNSLGYQQFAREMEIVTRLHHPHIVEVYATGVLAAAGAQPAPYIVMELVQGCGLDQLCGLTFARIIDLSQQICEALDYAHSLGYVHRDLKPENVLVEKRGLRYFAKLADFGLARPSGAALLDQESETAGTVFYLAPEVIAGQPASIRSDLYALGAMMYEMITGRVPFSDFFDDQAIYAQHLAEPAAPPSQTRPDIPPALESIVLRLLAKDPQERCASAAEVRQALEQAAAPRPAQPGGLQPAGSAPSLTPGVTPGVRPFVTPAVTPSQLAQLSRLLESSRLVTLTSPEDAAIFHGRLDSAGPDLWQRFPDGAWLAHLGDLSEPAQVLPAVLAALGVASHPGRSLVVSLVECLREKSLLLILTGCERHLPACAQLAGTILRACPEVHILAVCPAPFNLPGETTGRLAGETGSHAG